MKRNPLSFLALVFLSSIFIVSTAQAAALQQAHNIDEKLLVQNYKAANPSYERAKALYQKQKFEEAEKLLDECLNRMPEHNDAHYLKAQIAYRRNDLEKALDHMEKAMRYFALTVKILARQQLDQRAEIEKLGKQNEEMIAALQDQYSRATDPSAKSRIQVQINEQQRQLSNVRDRLKNPMPVIDKPPAEYHHFLGNIQFRLKRHEEAEKNYLAAIEVDPLHLQSYNNLVNLYFMAGLHDKALHFIEQAEGLGLKINEELKKAVLKALGR